MSARTIGSPHRPYEGYQLAGHVPREPGAPVLIVPTRGTNTCFASWPGGAGSSSSLRGVPTRSRGPRTCGPRRPHRPYEGYQQLMRTAGRDEGGRRSSSSLRGVPTRSSGTSRTGSCSPHRPYEGYQPEHRRRSRRVRRVLIAPTRGTNRSAIGSRTSLPTSSLPLRGVPTTAVGVGEGVRDVLIAPTRGTNPYWPSTPSPPAPSSSPLRGVPTWQTTTEWARATRSSSPLRGAPSREFRHTWRKRADEPVQRVNRDGEEPGTGTVANACTHAEPGNVRYSKSGCWESRTSQPRLLSRVSKHCPWFLEKLDLVQFSLMLMTPLPSFRMSQLRR